MYLDPLPALSRSCMGPCRWPCLQEHTCAHAAHNTLPQVQGQSLLSLCVRSPDQTKDNTYSHTHKTHMATASTRSSCPTPDGEERQRHAKTSGAINSAADLQP